MTKEEFFIHLNGAFAANGLSALLNPEACERFYLLTEEMNRVGAQMNLTTIREIPAIVVRHYADCALGVSYLPQGVSVVDVGTGAGFPSLPFAILRPDITVCAMDATQKKLSYVENTAKLLGLSGFSVVAGRAEELGQNPLYREQFDVVTARAVAPLNILAEWCMPFAKKNGYFLAMKGKGGMEELTAAKRAVDTLGGITERAETVDLRYPAEAGCEPEKRVLILIKKRQFTPKLYPRVNTRIQKKPL